MAKNKNESAENKNELTENELDEVSGGNGQNGNPPITVQTDYAMWV